MKFDSDFMKKLEYLSLVSRRTFRGQLFAQRRTAKRGEGVEFADYRDYTPGDDLRYLDWNVFARFENLLVKRFQEEEDLHVYFFLDASRSMAVGNPKKFDYGRQVTAALAYIALADLDRVSVISFDSKIRGVYPLTRGKDHVLSLLQYLEEGKTSGTSTDLAATAEEFIHRRQRTGLAVVVSDFFDPAGFQGGIDLLRYRGYEPNLVQVFDPREADPRLRGDLELVDLEGGDSRTVTVSESVLTRYRKRFAAFMEEIHRYTLAAGIGHTVARTDVPFDDLILRMMSRSAVVE